MSYKRLPAGNLYKVELFYNLQWFYKRLINKNARHYRFLVLGVLEGVVNPNLSIAENYKKFLETATDEMKASKYFGLALKEFDDTLNALDENTKKDFYSKRLIDMVLECELVPYEQVDITKMYFTNPNMSDKEKLKFIYDQTDAIYNGGNDFRIINSLDKVNIDPEFLKSDLIYQMFMEYLVNCYVVCYDKYKEKDKNVDKIKRYVIRMVYRHLNRGYYAPVEECKEKIINTYAYNGWFKEMRHMIGKNTLGITKDNYLRIIEEINNGFDDMNIVCNFSRGEYINMADKFNELITMVSEVVNDEQKLVRKDED